MNLCHQRVRGVSLRCHQLGHPQSPTCDPKARHRRANPSKLSPRPLTGRHHGTHRAFEQLCLDRAIRRDRAWSRNFWPRIRVRPSGPGLQAGHRRRRVSAYWWKSHRLVKEWLYLRHRKHHLSRRFTAAQAFSGTARALCADFSKLGAADAAGHRHRLSDLGQGRHPRGRPS